MISWGHRAGDAGGAKLSRDWARAVKTNGMKRNKGFADRQFRCVVCRGFDRSISGHEITDLSGHVGLGFGRLPADFRFVELGIERGVRILLSQGVAGFMSKAPCQSV